VCEQPALALQSAAIAGQPTITADHPVAGHDHGELDALDRISTETAGTAFQRAVWTALRGIEAGRTVSYGALAEHIGRPRAVRAVGAANGANPIAVVVPCHRVIGSDRGLTGYGGGLERKRWLLAHEGALLM
jgi:methylated-DNA-[protein]-cysteine S-methyltransferase